MRASFKQVRAAVGLANLFITVEPDYTPAAAAAKVCDLEKIVDARDRRAVLRLLECRLQHVYGKEAAA